MVYIFSNKRVTGLDGKYMNPKFYDGNLKDVDVVYTDDDRIKADADALGIPVKSIEKHLGTGKKEETVIPDETDKTGDTDETDVVEQPKRTGRGRKAN